MIDFPPVVLERECRAPIETVFQAWTDPAILMKWFRSSESTVVKEAKVDLRVGGRYRITVGHDEQEDFVLFGTYTQIEEPHLLEFTWEWKDGSHGQTLVRLDLSPSENGTRLKLTHSRFINEESAKAHDQGWTGVLSSLQRLFENEAK